VQRIRSLSGYQQVDFTEDVHVVDWRITATLAVKELLKLVLDGLDEYLKLRAEIVTVLVRVTEIDPEDTDGGRLVIARLDELEQQLARLADDLEDTLENQVTHRLDDLYNQLIYAGTALESREYRDMSRHELDTEKLRVAAAAHVRSWDTDLRTRLSQVKIDLGFRRFLSSVELETSGAVDQITRPFSQELIPAARAIAGKLEHTADEFQELARSNKSTRKTLISRLNQKNRELSELLQSTLLNRVASLAGEGRVADYLEVAIAEIILNNHLLTAETTVFSEPDTPERTRPRTDTEKIDFRQEMTVYMNHELFRVLRTLPAALQPLIGAVEELSGEIKQIVDVNLEIADDIATEKNAQADAAELHELIHDGLDRASQRTLDLIGRIEVLLDTAGTRGLAPVRDFKILCERIMREDDYLYIRKRNREVRMKSTAMDWKQRLQRRWENLNYTIEAAGRLSARKGGLWYRTLSGLLGFRLEQSSGTIIQNEVSEFLSSTDNTLKQLPLIYRRLFTADPLQESRFYRGRQAVHLDFDQALQTWQNGGFANFALVGEKGSGKTSIVNQLEQHLPAKARYLRGEFFYTTYEAADMLRQLCDVLGMQKVDSAEAFIEQVNASKNKTVVFLEGFQNLYLRNMNGFEALEAMLLIVTRTGKSIFWAVSCSRYAWQYLDKIYDLNGYFTHSRFSDQVEVESLKDVILSRHRASGYELRFEPSAAMLTSRSYRRLAGRQTEQQVLLQNRYFEELHERSKGNIAIALVYWQLSVKQVDSDAIVINSLDDRAIRLGEGYSPDDLFALGAIVMHDDLTVEQMALVLNLDVKTCTMILSKLYARSVLRFENERYYLNKLLYRPVVDLLKTKNILH